MRLIAAIACLAVLVPGVNWAEGQATGAKQGAAKKSTPGKVAAAKDKGKPTAAKGLLPDSFAGWVADGAVKKITDPAQADGANAAALKEYEFEEGATADYTRSGETL